MTASGAYPVAFGAAVASFIKSAEKFTRPTEAERETILKKKPMKEIG